MVGWPWLNVRCSPELLPPQLDRGEGIQWKACKLRTGERSLTSYHHGYNRLDLGILIEIIAKQNQSRIMRDKTNLKNTFPAPLLPLLPSSTSCPPAVQGGKEWDLQSLNHMFFLLLLRERGLSHRTLLFINFSDMSPSYRLQFFMSCSQVGHCSWDAVLQAEPAPV